MTTNEGPLARTDGLVVVFPGQVFDADIVAGPLARYRDDPLVHELAELVGTDAWHTLDCTDPAVAGPCTLVGGLLTARHSVDRGRVVATAGHSFGEITALAYAGGLADGDAMRVVARRGELSRACAEERPGAMAAVMGVPMSEVEWVRRATMAETDGLVEVAAVNDRQQFVLTGDRHPLDIAVARLAAHGAGVALLPIPGAYHSPIMHPAVDRLADHMAATPLAPLDVPVYSAIDGQSHRDPVAYRELIPRGLVMPVRWRETLEALAADGATEAVDAGPGEVLWKLGKRSRVLRFRTLAAADQQRTQETVP
jgi:[acyl-carrier-protein] S-malonyltransferase